MYRMYRMYIYIYILRICNAHAGARAIENALAPPLNF